MSNETQSDKKPTAPAAPKDTLTRVPVKHLYFADNLDFQGQSQVSNLKCGRHPEGAGAWYTCDFIPAWQQFEITQHRVNVEPAVRLMPTLHVRTWEKA